MTAYWKAGIRHQELARHTPSKVAMIGRLRCNLIFSSQRPSHSVTLDPDAKFTEDSRRAKGEEGKGSSGLQISSEARVQAAGDQADESTDLSRYTGGLSDTRFRGWVSGSRCVAIVRGKTTGWRSYGREVISPVSNILPYWSFRFMGPETHVIVAQRALAAAGYMQCSSHL